MVKDVFFKGLTTTTIPLSLIAFDATKLPNNTNRLTWITVNEQNVSHFDIERSGDGLNFVKIGETKAVGNTKAQQTYAFNDNTPLSILSYYRLKTTDLDGSSTLSKVVVVDNSNRKGSSLALFPNPVSDALTLVHVGLDGDLVLTVSDAFGKKVLTQTIKNGEQTNLNTTDLTSGVYFKVVLCPLLRQSMK